MEMGFATIPGKEYYMGKYAVTQKQWKEVMGTTPRKGEFFIAEGDDHPASFVSWDDCREFVERLNERDEMNEYRLPTGEEWEHACRAGNTGEYCFGDDPTRLKEYARFDENTGKVGEPYPHEVGRKKPNEWGLYDMHGNVREWCLDRPGLGSKRVLRDLRSGSDDERPRYSRSSERGDTDRILRGGCWTDSAEKCRSSEIFRTSPFYSSFYIGFRLVRF